MRNPARLPIWAWALIGALSIADLSAIQAEERNDDNAAAEARESEDDAPLERIEEEIEVRSRADDLVGIAFSASEGTTGRLDLERRALARAGEIVESTPGVVATQHSGGGKANQFFLRGFNLDHGTDFSIRVGGVPVNLPSHGHGQGYADLSFLIPETIDRVRFRKGPYWADRGDFSAAGSLDVELARSLPRDLFEVRGGSYGEARLLWLGSFPGGREGDAGPYDLGHGDSDLLAAVELFRSDGPWTRGDDYEGLKTFLRWERGDPSRGSSVTLSGYDADWLSTDQIPRRAVAAGDLDRFDLVDPGPRGRTARWSLAAEGHRRGSDSDSSWNVWGLSYDFRLVSNFTYLLEDPENGDQFEQFDERLAFGGDFRRSWHQSWRGRPLELSLGVDLRADDVDNGLLRTRDLEPLGTVRADRIRQLLGGPWAEASLRVSPRFRARLGLRAAAYVADVESDLEINSGDRDDLLLSPKLSLVFGPWQHTELAVNFGFGHHSNDARGAVIRVDPTTGEPVAAVDPLVRARGVDVGLRTSALEGSQATFTVFGLELDSELLFVGDGGATEASRPSRRIGVEATWAQRIGKRFQADLDVTWTDAEFTDGKIVGGQVVGDRIPGAVETTVAAGVSWLPPAGAGWFGGSRWRYFAGAPLTEDGSVTASTTSLVSARLGRRFVAGSRTVDVELEVFNLLDRESSDIEYYYASRLPGEPPEGVEDVHLHPVAPRALRLVVGIRY